MNERGEHSDILSSPEYWGGHFHEDGCNVNQIDINRDSMSDDKPTIEEKVLFQKACSEIARELKTGVEGVMSQFSKGNTFDCNDFSSATILRIWYEGRKYLKFEDSDLETDVKLKHYGIVYSNAIGKNFIVECSANSLKPFNIDREVLEGEAIITSPVEIGKVTHRKDHVTMQYEDFRDENMFESSLMQIEKIEIIKMGGSSTKKENEPAMPRLKELNPKIA